jgi:hypothetical protein
MTKVLYGEELTHVTFREYDTCRKIIRYVAGLVPRPHVSLGHSDDITIASSVLADLFDKEIVSRKEVVKLEKVEGQKSDLAFEDRNATPARPRKRPHGDDPKRIRGMIDGLLQDLGLS